MQHWYMTSGTRLYIIHKHLGMKFDRFNQQLGESFKRELTIMETMHRGLAFTPGPTQASESLDYSSVVEISLRGCAQILPAKLVPSHYLAIAEESYVPFQQSMQINRMAAVANREEDGARKGSCHN